MNINNIKNQKILVIGDIILDKYIFGDVSRLSPEAPIPILNHEKTDFRLGGAANVANNISSLGGIPYLAGVIGNDKESEILTDLLKKNKITGLNIIDKSRPTTIKERVLARYSGHPYQQLLRIDREHTIDITEQTEKNILANIKLVIDKVSCVVFSDYNKGLLTKNLISKIKNMANGKTIMVNVKPPKGKMFNGVTWIISNLAETKKELSLENSYKDKIETLGHLFMKKFKPKHFLMTAGSDGMFLYTKENCIHIKTTARDVADVSGAGDTVVATLSLAIASKLDPLNAVKIANCAAGLSVEKLGTSTISLKELSEAIKRNNI